MMWRWAVVAGLLVVSCWFVNMAVANWWAAGGPPTLHREEFATRGNMSIVLAVVFLSAAVLLAVASVRKMRQHRERSA